MMEPVVLAPQGVAGVAAIRLRPAAARSLLGFPLAGGVGLFRRSRGYSFRRLTLALRAPGRGPDDGERIRALEEWLTRAVASCAAAARRGNRRRRLSGAAGRAPIDALAAQSGTSLRQLERQFRDDVGLTPKTFSRIVRLQSALKRVRQGRALTDVALACGFYDQAHMTRDFREIAAMSPGAWQSHAGDLAPLFVAT